MYSFTGYEMIKESLKKRYEQMKPFEWFPIPEDLPSLEETIWVTSSFEPENVSQD